jgi:hypothetical protein
LLITPAPTPSAWLGLDGSNKEQMKTTLPRPTLDEITETLEDTIEHLSKELQLSGQLLWTVTECLATAKLSEFPND